MGMDGQIPALCIQTLLYQNLCDEAYKNLKASKIFEFNPSMIIYAIFANVNNEYE